MKKTTVHDVRIFGKEALPHLWLDEIGDVLLLKKHMEVYVYDNTTLGCHCWSRKPYFQLQKSGLIFDDRETDDSLVCFKTKRSNLPSILSLGAFKRRPHHNGRWIKDKERRLGHRIRPPSAEQKAYLRSIFSNAGTQNQKSGKTAWQSGLSNNHNQRCA